MASITSSASIASSNAHAQSETSSPAASLSGANPSLPPSSNTNGWKSRFGHPRRIRAGSVESNFTGRSMVSLEEEDEEEEEAPPKTTDEDDSNRQRPKRQTTIRAARDRKLSNQSASLSLRSIASVASARERARSITVNVVSADPQELPPTFDRSATQSPESTTSSRGPEDWTGEDESERGVEVEVPSLSFAPFTGSSTSAVSTNVVTPVTPLMTLGVPPKKGKAPTSLSLSQVADDSVRIAVQDSTPMTSRISPSQSYEDHPSTSVSDLPSHEVVVPPGPTNSLLPFPKRSSSRNSFNGSLALPPPSASVFKQSFGASDLTLPTPSASARKLAFRGSDLTLPPPSSSAHKTSFGAAELQLPPNRKSKSKSRPAEPPSANPYKTSFGASEVEVQFATRKFPSLASDSISETLDSPVSSDNKKSLPSALPTLSVSSAEPVQVSLAVSPTTPVARRPFDISLSRKGPEFKLFGSSKAKEEPTSSKRGKTRPVPAPLALKQDESSKQDKTVSENPRPSYVLSSSHRSSSSISSNSSSSSSRSLRNHLLSRVTSGSGSKKKNSSPLPTPQQTLFIFPPSPTSSQEGALPSQTPSTMTLMATPAADKLTFGGPTFPLLTPTPTLATFRTGSRRSSIMTNSSSSSGVSLGSASGWISGAPSTPTTACSKVDAKGWFGF